MSMWTGFLIGLVLALTLVMTLVRPVADSGLDSESAAPSTALSPPASVQASRSPPAVEAVVEMPAAPLPDERPVEAAAVQDEPITPIPEPDESMANGALPKDVADTLSASTSTAALSIVDPPVRTVVIEPAAVNSDLATINDDALQWYSFWHPFTSELSANGFRDRLERVTGLNYRVVRDDSGEFHVAVAYQDEQSRESNLVAIEAATGLNLRGASF